MRRIIIFAAVIFLLILGPGCEKRYAKLTVNEAFPEAQSRRLANAAAAGNTNEIDRLIAGGADVNVAGKYKLTPLWWSLITGNYDGFSHLLDKGANPNLQFDGGYDNVVYSSAQRRDSRFLQKVLKVGGNVNLVSHKDKNYSFETISEGTTPLFGAIIGSNRGNVDLLIAKGADINFQDPDGATPAMVAAYLNSFEIVYDLLTNGADPTIKDKAGQTIVWDLKLKKRLQSDDHNLWREKVERLLKEKGISTE
jgi:ankyrin repeat protein